MIVSGGLNVYPREVEDVIAAHPSVLEAIVVGVPHDKWGEAVAAFVSLQPGKELSLADLTKHCRDEGLASYKKPLTLEIVDDYPKRPRASSRGVFCAIRSGSGNSAKSASSSSLH